MDAQRAYENYLLFNADQEFKMLEALFQKSFEKAQQLINNLNLVFHAVNSMDLNALFRCIYAMIPSHNESPTGLYVFECVNSMDDFLYFIALVNVFYLQCQKLKMETAGVEKPIEIPDKLGAARDNFKPRIVQPIHSVRTRGRNMTFASLAYMTGIFKTAKMERFYHGMTQPSRCAFTGLFEETVRPLLLRGYSKQASQPSPSLTEEQDPFDIGDFLRLHPFQ